MAPWIVTIKLPRNPQHDPKNKQRGTCIVSDICTDITGQHHSFLVLAENETQAIAKAGEHFQHVTRVEKAEYPLSIDLKREV